MKGEWIYTCECIGHFSAKYENRVYKIYYNNCKIKTVTRSPVTYLYSSGAMEYQTRVVDLYDLEEEYWNDYCDIYSSAVDWNDYYTAVSTFQLWR